MEHNEILARLPSALLPWYEENKRDLPWRADREPYHVWISEIMLQQTRVEAVKGYYSRFLEKLPTIEALANADDEVLHKLWEGLGYYSRVRNLKKAAQTVMGQYDGIFPMDYESVLTLPGIGEYTAGAICSICYDLPTPAVDGNVLRVISRIADDATPVGDPKHKKQIRESLEQVYPTEAGAFTQALMELGATLCGPNWKPRCKECPCREFCQGYLNGTAESLPVKAPKKQKRIEEYTVFLLSCGELMAIEKRPETGLLADLWQFPNVSKKLEPDQALEFLTKMGLKPRELLRQAERKHVFTHIRWEMRGYWVEVDSPEGGFRWLTPEELAGEAALPTAFRQFLESY
jgi:A/G-specific adenine glycosylase